MNVQSSREIGKKVRFYRLRAGLTQEKLAEEVGVTFQQIQKYENGSTKLNTDKLQQICGALDISVGDLFPAKERSPDRLTHDEERLIDAFRKIPSDHHRQSLVAVAEAIANR
ncbi:MAG: helix-turn-helix transcriptional regulator [Geobacter sp.]|nr:MAG: helix-turn-helix transcriptional regulator [Geobacter sp.]